MKVFHCDSCKHLVYFENVSCLNCGHKLAFVPTIGAMSAMEPLGDSGDWTALSPLARKLRFRLCANGIEHGICNWTVPAEDPNPLCLSCRQTRIVPNLSTPENLQAWRRMEVAKRHLVYSLLLLKLPCTPKSEDPEQGVAYEFLSDELVPGDGAVLTGHDEGVITINIAEADDAERERRRVTLHEPYRTLLGHFRHEVGHYYWDRLIQDSPRLQDFRALFGDETADYAEALKHHYEQGAQANWQESYISAYASSHPWEDWAESWAHYLHMIDALETAASCGVSMKAQQKGDPSLKLALNSKGPRGENFDTMIENWLALTYTLNNLNRSLGLGDGYPFVLSKPVIEKLRFVHRTISLYEPVSAQESVAA